MLALLRLVLLSEQCLSVEKTGQIYQGRGCSFEVMGFLLVTGDEMIMS